MGFKSGKANVWTETRERIEALELELAAERTKPMLKLFAERLGHAMMVQLAVKPYAEWPQFAKDTFAWVASDVPTAAWAYKEALPK